MGQFGASAEIEGVEKRRRSPSAPSPGSMDTELLMFRGAYVLSKLGKQVLLRPGRITLEFSWRKELASAPLAPRHSRDFAHGSEEYEALLGHRRNNLTYTLGRAIR
jgi:hypothetical protein